MTRLQTLRLALGLSRAAMGKRVGLSVSRLGRIETGQVNPTRRLDIMLDQIERELSLSGRSPLAGGASAPACGEVPLAAGHHHSGAQDAPDTLSIAPPRSEPARALDGAPNLAGESVSGPQGARASPAFS